MDRLLGKVALVTGGGTGIGQGIALHIVAEGGKVLLVGRRSECLRATAAAISAALPDGADRVAHCAADVRDPVAMEQAVTACVQAFGRLDVLICNAGASLGPRAFEATDAAAWNQMLDVNLKGIVHGVQAALPELKSRRGNILVISSTSALRPGRASTLSYAAAKAGATALASGLALELAPAGVRVNVICPGWIETPMAEDIFRPTHGAAFRKAMEETGRSIPLGRMGRPDDVAKAALYLVSDEAAWVTGAVLVVDGGDTLG